MKMTAGDFDRLKTAISGVISQHPLARAEYRAKGLSDTRFAWDCLHASKFDTVGLYHYLNDSHITTALLRIITKGN